MLVKMNYLVVGGSSGIGLALVKKLASEGHQVFSASRQKGDLPENVTFISLDVLEDISSLKDQLPDTLDGLAYCPGTINLKPFGRLTEEDFLLDYRVNVLVIFRFTNSVGSDSVWKNMLKIDCTSSAVRSSSLRIAIGPTVHSR